MSNQISAIQHQKAQKAFVDVIQAQIDDTEQLAVNARDLHKFLGVQSKFAEWINRRIKEYGFVKNQDFIIISEISETMTKNGQRRATTSKQYHITLDMAKELAMVEKNAKGREIRRYFIECEKQTLTQNYSLIDQYNKALLELDKFSDMASQAGRTLNLAGKRFKPKARQKVFELTLKIHPLLPFVEFKGE